MLSFLDPDSTAAGLARRVLVLAVLGVLLLGGRELRGGSLGEPAVAPNGIVSFELAGDAQTAQQIVDLWEDQGRIDDARRSVRLDFLFIVVYSALLALVFAWAVRRVRVATEGWPRLWQAFWVASYVTVGTAAIVVAALADLAENLQLLDMLDGPTDEAAAAARSLALLKFGAIGVVVLLVAPVWFGTAIAKYRRRSRAGPQ